MPSVYKEPSIKKKKSHSKKIRKKRKTKIYAGSISCWRSIHKRFIKLKALTQLEGHGKNFYRIRFSSMWLRWDGQEIFYKLQDFCLTTPAFSLFFVFLFANGANAAHASVP